MPAYLVQLPGDNPSLAKFNGVDSMVIFAADANDAKAMAKSQIDGDANAPWGNATVTEIAAAANLIGFTFNIVVTSPAGEVVANVSQVCTGASHDTIDEVGALLATALNATDDIANAAYNTSTQVLTVATGSGGDDLGDHTVTVKVFKTDAPDPEPIPGFVDTITHEGAADAALSVEFPADAFVVPKVTALLRSA